MTKKEAETMRREIDHLRLMLDDSIRRQAVAEGALAGVVGIAEALMERLEAAETQIHSLTA